MFKKQVKCSECGFLGIQYELDKSLELPVSSRIRIPQWSAEDTPPGFGCLRGQDYLIAGTTSPDERHTAKDMRDNIGRPRRCVYYFPYNPGYTPNQHLELQRERGQRRFLIIVSLLSAAVGAGIATVVNLIWS